MRKIVLINCLWAAVAAGAFFIGQKDKASKSIENNNLPNSTLTLQRKGVSTQILAIGPASQEQPKDLKALLKIH